MYFEQLLAHRAQEFEQIAPEQRFTSFDDEPIRLEQSDLRDQSASPVWR
jgi:hypothetical protein